MVKALSSMHGIYVFSSLLTDIIVSKLNATFISCVETL